MVDQIMFYSSYVTFYNNIQVQHISEIRHSIGSHLFKAQHCPCLRLRQGQTRLSYQELCPHGAMGGHGGQGLVAKDSTASPVSSNSSCRKRHL